MELPTTTSGCAGPISAPVYSTTTPGAHTSDTAVWASSPTAIFWSLVSQGGEARIMLRTISLRRFMTIAPFMFAVGGCAQQSSPSLPLFGAYFPSWLLCAVVGIFGALAARVVFIRSGIDDALPWHLLVYVSLAAAIAFSLALLIYGR